MSIRINKNTKATCQGFTDKNGTFHSRGATTDEGQVMLMVTPREPHAPSPPPERGRSVRAANRVGVNWSCVLAGLFLMQSCFLAPAIAEPAADRSVELLKNICVSPSTPEEMIEAGNRAAVAGNWKLLGAAPAPLPIMHNENGPKISFMSAWELPFAAGARGRLVISIVRPEIPGVRHSVCIVEPADDIGFDVMADTLERQFSSLVVRDTRRWTGSRKWFFAEERERGNCGRSIILFEHKPASLMYFDSAYPNDGNWKVPFSETLCRS